jgi:hypothetical protein
MTSPHPKRLIFINAGMRLARFYLRVRGKEVFDER